MRRGSDPRVYRRFTAVLAKARSRRFLFDYIDGGSYSAGTMRSNAADMQTLKPRQQVMRDVSAIDLSTTMMGRKVDASRWRSARSGMPGSTRGAARRRPHERQRRRACPSCSRRYRAAGWKK